METDWGTEQRDALDGKKQLITKELCLKYYDVDADTIIEADASDYGLGAVLLQDGQPIAYASRTLSKTEKGYAQIEKEMLALVFAAERFDQYLFFKSVIFAKTDHKMLEMIFKKLILDAPKRLQRMRLRLQKYRLEVLNHPGKQMHISDALSRVPPPETKDKSLFAVQLESIDCATYLNVSDKRFQQVRRETQCERKLQILIDVLTNGWPSQKEEVPISVRDYWVVRGQLSVQNGVVYRGTRIVIPIAMQKEFSNCFTAITRVSKPRSARLGIYLLAWHVCCYERHC